MQVLSCHVTLCAWPVAEAVVEVQLGASRSASVHFLVHLIVRLCGKSYPFAFFSSCPKSGIVVCTKPLIAKHLRRSWHVVAVRNRRRPEAEANGTSKAWRTRT